MKTTLLQLIFTGIVITLVALSPVVPPVAAADMSLDQMIENAKTKADHEAIAKHYEAEAKTYQAMAEQHKKMEASYQIMSQGKGGVAGFVAHCKKLVSKYEELAKEDLELARLHRQFAKKLDQ